MGKAINSLLTTAASVGLSVAAHADALTWANGHWGLPSESKTLEHLNCETAPLVVSINSQKNIYSAKHGETFRGEARILDHGQNFIKIKYVDEERLMDNGGLHIWTMYFLSENEFVWVRDDWIKDGVITNSTESRVRCAPGLA